VRIGFRAVRSNFLCQVAAHPKRSFVRHV
jgi:hypothetical protein